MTDASKPIVGTGGGDLLEGTSGEDRMIGAAGDDVLRGLGGDDALVGGTGDDVLEGGAGSDELSGGHGSDVFVFGVGDVKAVLPQDGSTEVILSIGWGDDVVTDFDLGEDSLQFGDGDGPVFAAAEAAQYLQLTQVDVDQDGRLDTVIRIDFVDVASGIHYSDPASSITLLGVSGASLAELVAVA